MNLRALLDGKDVVLPLDDVEWDRLQQRLRLKEIELAMPCCNGRAYMRVSPAGTQHFVHQVDTGCEQSESEIHHLAKIEIVKACRELGLPAIPEALGDGWRADVLVTHPKWKVAFEVQVSSQSFEETIQRQQVYKSHGVRCCWLFLEPPARKALKYEQLSLVSQYSTPIFHLRYRRAQSSPFSVEVNGEERSLMRFICDLLTKKLRFARSRAVSGVKAKVDLWKTFCATCGCTMYIFGVDALEGKAECGAEISLALNRFALLYPDSFSGFLDRYVLGIPKELHEFLQINRQQGLPYREFVCTGCKTRIAEKPMDHSRLKSVTSLAFTTSADGNQVPLNHWCDDPDCLRISGDSEGEIQDSLSRADLKWDCTGIYNFNRTIDYKSKLPYRHYATYNSRM